MGRLNNDEQFKFLISCIRYSNNGKVDFSEVAKECSIVSKGAAAKRYERMMKAHNIYQAAPVRESVASTPRRKAEPAEQQNKKRKADQFADHEGAEADDDEGLCDVKSEALGDLSMADDPVVKHEPQHSASMLSQVEHISHGTIGSHPWLGYRSTLPNSTSTDDNVFNDFINGAAFEPVNGQPRFPTGQEPSVPTQYSDNPDHPVNMEHQGEMAIEAGAGVFVID